MNLFSNFGIKGVSMNQIAGALQMSKKTLYAEFENKEKLLSACMDNEKERVSKILYKIEQDAHNPLEIILLTISDMNHYRSNFCPAFFKDIQQFNEPYEKMNNFKASLHERYMMHFQQGVDEQYFLADYKYEPFASLLVDQLGNWNNVQQPSIILAFVRGICTSKGAEALNSFCFPTTNAYKENRIGIVF